MTMLRNLALRLRDAVRSLTAKASTCKFGSYVVPTTPGGALRNPGILPTARDLLTAHPFTVAGETNFESRSRDGVTHVREPVRVASLCGTTGPPGGDCVHGRTPTVVTGEICDHQSLTIPTCWFAAARVR